MRPVLILLMVIWVLPCIAQKHKQSKPKPKPRAAERPGYVDGMRVLTQAEQMPEFPGGEMEMLAFIGRHMNYSFSRSVGEEIQDRVIITFVVDTLGDLRGIKLARPFEKGKISPCEQEVIKVVRKMPRWIPGRSKGKKVPVQYVLPVYDICNS